MKTERKGRNGKGFLLAALITIFLLSMPAGAAVPPKITHQGFLTTAEGNPVTGTVPIVFTIYNSGGTALWTETRNVSAANGVYSVILGEITPINLPFDAPYFLGIRAGADPEMTPRQALTSVGYAFRASATDTVSSHTHGAEDIAGGTLGTDRFSAYADLVAEGVLGAGSDSSILTRGTADPRYVLKGQANTISTPMILDGQVTKPKLSASGGTAGQVLGTDGANLVWQNDISGFTLPYIGWLSTDQAAFWVNNFGPQGTGIWGLATNGIGVYGEGNGSPGWGVWGKHTGTGNYGQVGTAPAGVYAYGFGNSRGVHAQSEGATGVHGQSGGGYGVYGESASGEGVSGRHAGMGNHGHLGTYAAGAAGFGLGNARGIHGQAENATGVHGESVNGYGAYGVSANGTGMAAVNAATGNYADIGTAQAAIRAVAFSGLAGDFVGRIRTRVIEITGGADLSEGFEIRGPLPEIRPAPGMVVSIDPASPGKLKVSHEAYDRKVAGIISGAGGVNPGMLMGHEGSAAAGAHPVALTGRVYCWADAARGPIAPGDLLTTSETPGYAMKAADYARAQGAVIGKAMTGLDSGKGLVLVLVALQ
jgi:hypothetical protein